MQNFLVPNYKPLSVIPYSAKGVWIYDKKGKDYLDLGGGIAVTCLGHCHPEIVDSLEKQAKLLWHTSNYYNNHLSLELASKLVKLTFAERVFFANSGSEANEAALKLARLYAFKKFSPNKNLIHSFYNSFHGRSLFTVTVGGTESYTTGFSPLPGSISHSSFNDLAALSKSMSDKSCAVILEPIQGEGGIKLAEISFIKKVRELCDQHQACLIFDEIQTGVGRTGYFYAYQQWDLEPDILTTAKALGCGFPISAMLTKKHIAEVFQPGSHGSTFGGNPLACSVANKVVEIVSDAQFLLQVQQKSLVFFQKLQDLNEKYELFTSIRGQGLMIGAELKLEYSVKDFLSFAVNNGILVLMAGDNVLRLLPALNILEKEIEIAFDRLEKTIKDFLQFNKTNNFN